MHRLQLLCVPLLALAVCFAPGRAAETAEKPNIIFILADDLGYGDVGCFGQQKIATPNLDRMAAEGMRFTQFYAGSTVCAPSRCVLMTGKHTGHARVRGNGGGRRQALDADTPTVAKMLQKAGYRTALIGKWGLGEPGPGAAGMPRKQGFDYFFGYLNQGHAHYYYTDHLWRNEEKVELPGNKNGKREQYSHDLIEAEALKWVKQNKDQPFFLYLAVTIPHAEVLVPEDSSATYQGRWKEKPFVNKRPYGQGYASSPTPRASFAGMVSRLDRTVGRVLALLEQLNIDENTLVIFTSDNGPHLEGGADPDFFDSNGPLRGYKRDLYEGGIREPTIVRWPGHVPAGTTSDFIGYSGDFFATAAALTGAELPPNRDSVSFLPTLLGEGDKQKQHEFLYWEFYERGGARAVRMGKWKAVRPKWNAPLELYDLSKDIGEKHNVAQEHPDLADKLAKIMEEQHVDSVHWPEPGKKKKRR
jgi:arylsulfatase A-like enzyme